MSATLAPDCTYVFIADSWLFEARWRGDYLIRLSRVDRSQADDSALEISQLSQWRQEQAENLQSQVQAFLGGYLRSFEVPFHLSGSDFQCRVWRSLQQIPYGQVLTYGQLAKNIDRPGAAQAVGQAVGANPLLFIVPCHRIVAAHHAGGFSAGMDLKHHLLRMEGHHYQS